MKDSDVLNMYSEKLQRMLQAKENVQKMNEARQAEQQQFLCLDQLRRTKDLELLGRLHQQCTMLLTFSTQIMLVQH